MVKIFISSNPYDLETDINSWLAENKDNVTVKSVSYAIETSKDYFSALVFYGYSQKAFMKEVLENFHQKG